MIEALKGLARKERRSRVNLIEERGSVERRDGVA